MSRETKARAGAQAAVGDDRVLDVALTVPRGSTFAGAVGMGLGAAIGGGGSSTTAWEVGGLMVGRGSAARRQKMPPSVVLAVSETTLYALGRRRSGLFGSWRHQQLLVKIARTHLEITHRQRGTVLHITLADKTSGIALDVEAALVGNLGIRKFLDTIESVPGD
ncbi:MULTISPECIES: hypothetical protein [unclassified Rhodococcus (in: high G+C Gram-positive bacteria)]|uniref:hypothetical protein n=1 Tax=unclassified Rhodococcus (in: high G+C Gram-positive bacteria) TaxID=192944 RepID=UPI000B9AC6CF|nr:MULTISPECIES: hypothetical protein [unclassified Rhodococcus (in: high G+C Gram-positive bacteria)]OZE37637.1 hypothetical protein CH259_12420 [Rhodococcus sp. 05-2254-4]OZE40769.1 hypothetical protein CH261_27385 [Rhodococcus sp. 05-2254-3]OZE45760.1 hypothetical protein CH283_26040 [Rhodococcus sp. 05-2254-2]OZF52666.1 hypothetical protein CH291_02450 [Rhodococcus sp. 14-1411-2a]